MTLMLDSLYHRHVAAAFEKQMRLGKFLSSLVPSVTLRWHTPNGERSPGTLQDPLGLDADCSFDMRSGILKFGGRVGLRAQLLGLEDRIHSTRLWGWSSPPGISEEHLVASNRMRDYGSEQGLAEFTTETIPCATLFSDDLGIAGHGLSAIAVGVLGFDTYFPAPYDGGTVFVLLKDSRLRVDNIDPFPQVLSGFPACLRGLPISDHRSALLGYLEFHGFRPTVTGTELTASLDGKEILDAKFDGHGQLLKLTGTIEGRVHVAFG